MHFSAGMKVNEALAQHPSARWVFAAYHIGGCSGCASAEEETLEQVAVAYGIPLENLMRDLNSLAAQNA
jgi:hybrid cluster-associated redox disulfide protein